MQYPFVELFNGILYTIIYYHYGLSFEFLFYCTIVSFLIVISFIDYYYQIIPDILIVIILVWAVLYNTILLFVYEVPFNLLDSIFGLLFGGILFLIIALISKGGMGGGDIKLISVLGFILGFKKVILNIFLSFMIGAISSIFLLIFKIKGIGDAIPFGPFINIAFTITLLFGDAIISWYIYSFFF